MDVKVEGQSNSTRSCFPSRQYRSQIAQIRLLYAAIPVRICLHSLVFSPVQNSHTTQYSPPSMTFQQNTPREAHFPPPSSNGSTKDVIQIPNPKCNGYIAQSDIIHAPHGSQNFHIPLISSFLLDGINFTVSFTASGVEQTLHNPHAAQYNHRREQGEHILMEHRVLKIMIVQCDEDSQTGNREGDENTGQGCFAVWKDCVH